MNNTLKGKYGEQLAEKYLLEKGYLLRERNFRSGRAEIDLIVEKDKVLVFVEVKYRKNTNYGYPEEAVSKSKIDLLQKAADHYLEKIGWEGDIRFDILAINKTERDAVAYHHIEDAFY